MNITAIKNHLKILDASTLNSISEWQARGVNLLKQGLELVRTDKRVAGVTLVVANLIMLKIALWIVEVANKFFLHLLDFRGKDEVKNTNASSFIGLLLFSASIVGMNVALYQKLKLPLSPLATVAISITTCVSYILIRLWKVSGNQSK